MNSTLLAPAGAPAVAAPAEAVVAPALLSASSDGNAPSLFALLMDGLPASDGELATDTAAPEVAADVLPAELAAAAVPFGLPLAPALTPALTGSTEVMPGGEPAIAQVQLGASAGLPLAAAEQAAPSAMPAVNGLARAASAALTVPLMAGSLTAANVGRSGNVDNVGKGISGTAPATAGSELAAAPLAEVVASAPQPAEPRPLLAVLSALPLAAHELGQRPATAAATVPEWAPLPVDDGSASGQGGALHQLLAQRLAVQSSHGIDRALIRLDPPSFGSLEIALRHEGGHLTVQLTASNGDMARQLQGIGDLLRQELGNRQFQSVQLEVRHGAGDGQGGQQQGRREPEQQASPGRALQLAEDDGFGLAPYQAGAEA